MRLNLTQKTFIVIVGAVCASGAFAGPNLGTILKGGAKGAGTEEKAAEGAVEAAKGAKGAEGAFGAALKELDQAGKEGAAVKTAKTVPIEWHGHSCMPFGKGACEFMGTKSSKDVLDDLKRMMNDTSGAESYRVVGADNLSKDPNAVIVRGKNGKPMASLTPDGEVMFTQEGHDLLSSEARNPKDAKALKEREESFVQCLAKQKIKPRKLLDGGHTGH